MAKVCRSALGVAALLLSSVYGLAQDTSTTRSHTAAPSRHQCHSITTYLRPRLSLHAAVILPGSDQYLTLEIRASSPRISPTFSAIVEVATEEDVQQTVSLSR